MTRKELNIVRGVLMKIKGAEENPYVKEAVAYIDKDLAIRDRQSRDMIELNRDGWEFHDFSR